MSAVVAGSFTGITTDVTPAADTVGNVGTGGKRWGAVNAVSVNSVQVNASGSINCYTSTAPPAGGTAGSGFKLSNTSNFGVFFGSGVPTLAAAKGSLYLRTDGSTTNDRMYVNTNGSTTWTAVTTAA